MGTYEPLVFTVEEARYRLGLSRGGCYEAIRRGEIPSIRIGKRILIPRAALQRLLDGKRNPSRESAGLKDE
jgi:excisionase family DNA binding protein